MASTSESSTASAKTKVENGNNTTIIVNNNPDSPDSPDSEKKAGRRKITIEFIEDKSRRHITFSKRKAGIMKKAYELSTLTGTQVLLLVASETGHVYTFATPKLQPLITKPEGKNLIQACLNTPDAPQPTPPQPTPPQPQPQQPTPSSSSRQSFPDSYPEQNDSFDDDKKHSMETKPSFPSLSGLDFAGYNSQLLANNRAYMNPIGNPSQLPGYPLIRNPNAQGPYPQYPQNPYPSQPLPPQPQQLQSLPPQPSYYWAKGAPGPLPFLPPQPGSNKPN